MSLGGVLGINPLGYFELGTIPLVAFTPYRRPHGGRAARVHAGGSMVGTVPGGSIARRQRLAGSVDGTVGGGSISRRNIGGTVTDV